MMHDLLEQFPPVQHAFAYGSGVFKQPGLYAEKVQPGEGPMTDLIFAVDDPLAWHREIDWVAESIGSGVYFNTLIPRGSGMIKYGVVRLRTMQRDLLDWDSLYLAGRLHKPVCTLASSTAVMEAQTINLQSALRAALLLFDDEDKFSMRQLLRMLCALSYEGSYDRLTELYKPVLATAQHDWKVLDQSGDYFTQDCSPIARATLLAALPAAVLSKLAGAVGRPSPAPAQFDPAMRAALASDLAGYSQVSRILRRSLASIVRTSSARQTIAGALSAGAVKSVRYAWRKIKKSAKTPCRNL